MDRYFGMLFDCNNIKTYNVIMFEMLDDNEKPNSKMTMEEIIMLIRIWSNPRKDWCIFSYS